MMKINGIEAKPKDGQLRSIITYPAPKARLVNEWGDAPTQVDTSVALTPHAQSISEVMGIKADDEHTLKSSMILRDSNNVEVYGRVFKIRTSAFQFVPFSDRLTELALNGVIDEPSITQGTEVVEVTSLFTPLDGTQDHNRMTAIKAGAVENIDGLIGNYYVSDDKVVLDRVAFSVRGLIIAPIEELWARYEALGTALFAKKSLVFGTECEYSGFSTNDFTERSGKFYWEFTISFKTL